jgi:hypothetical protein
VKILKADFPLILDDIKVVKDGTTDAGAAIQWDSSKYNRELRP